MGRFKITCTIIPKEYSKSFSKKLEEMLKGIYLSLKEKEDGVEIICNRDNLLYCQDSIYDVVESIDDISAYRLEIEKISLFKKLLKFFS